MLARYLLTPTLALFLIAGCIDDRPAATPSPFAPSGSAASAIGPPGTN
jgi:hypothetical protein